MSILTLDVLGMCVVLRQGEAGPYQLGFLRDPGHVQTVHYRRPGEIGDRVTALSFLRQEGVLEIAGVVENELSIPKESMPRLPFMNRIGGLEFSTKRDVLNEFGPRIELPGGTLTPLESHIGDAASQWTFGRGSFCLTDRLRFSAQIAGPVALGNTELSADGAEDVHLTITSIDQDYGKRPKQRPLPGFSLTEFAHFYRCTTEYGPIPRLATHEAATARLDPDSPICPIVGVQL